jgi:uncharacterized protein (TIGR02266 family)
MRIKLKYPDVDTFIHKYSANISRGGIFISTRTPKPIGTRLKFEFLLAAPEGERCIIRGEGQVQWTKEYDPEGGSKSHGMGVKFTRLDAESQAIVDRALEYRAKKKLKESGEVVVPPPLAEAASAPSGQPNEDTDPGGIAVPQEPEAAAPAIPEVEAAPPAPPAVAAPPAPPPFEAAQPLEPARLQTARNASPETRDGRVPDAEARSQDPLDALAAELGVTDEQIAGVLATRRLPHPDPQAELERLLAGPGVSGATRAEALAELPALLGSPSPEAEHSSAERTDENEALPPASDALVEPSARRQGAR